MKVDITIEFYRKSAIYLSPITKHKTPIDIKQVYVETGFSYPDAYQNHINRMYCKVTIISTKDVVYSLNDLLFAE